MLLFTFHILGLLLGTIVLAKWLKLPDVILALMSNFMLAAGDIYISLLPSNSSYLMYYDGVIKLFTGLSGPAGRALLSKSVPEEDLGKCYGIRKTKIYQLSNFLKNLFFS